MEADWTRAIELAPDAETLNSRGAARRTRGDLEGAAADFSQAIVLKLDFAEAWSNRGEIKSAKGDLEGALADYNRAIELKPTLAVVTPIAASSKKAKRDVDGALADFNKAIELNPNLLAAHLSRGEIRRERARFSRRARRLQSRDRIEAGSRRSL